MTTSTIPGTYGSHYTPCDVIVRDDGWYVVAGSINVNRCDPGLLVPGVHVEELPDVDAFTWDRPIEDGDELDVAVED